MLTIEMLPAAHGDALWIEYGPASRPHRILIDGGPAHTYENGLRRRIATLKKRGRELELMVITHIDADHIDGGLILLQELATLKVGINALWFNGWPQISHAISHADNRAVSRGPLQGEFLGGLVDVDPMLKESWNRQFNHRAVAIPNTGPLPVVPLAGGATLTLLGPTEARLRSLRKRWATDIDDFPPGDVSAALSRLAERREYRPPAIPADTRGMAQPRKYGDDSTVANGSSIACVFEHAGVAVLLAGDAHARSLAASLKRLAEERSVARLHFDAVKLPHHGSMNNISKAWLQWVDCDHWLISTNGAVFQHPDVETAQLIADCHPKTGPKPTLLCNYQNIAERLAQEAGDRWKVGYPKGKTAGPAGGLRLSLLE